MSLHEQLLSCSVDEISYDYDRWKSVDRYSLDKIINNLDDFTEEIF